MADGGGAFAVRANLTDVEEIERLVDVALAKLGHIDILVNCAGVFFIRLLGELSEDEWDTTLDVNVKGPFFLTQKVVPHMVEREGGNVIFVGSIFGAESPVQRRTAPRRLRFMGSPNVWPSSLHRRSG